MERKQQIPQIDMQAVAMRLEAVRIYYELTRDAFSASFGLDPSSYSKLTKLRKTLKSEHAFAIAEKWGVSMDFLFRGDLSKLDTEMRAALLSTLVTMKE